MNQFSIKDIENLSGIKAHTLRIWEQRYGILIPKRKDSNHRFYDDQDLKLLLRISYLYHKGIKISKIAKLKHDEMIVATEKEATTDSTYNYFINKLLEASLDFDEVRFDSIFEQALEKEGLENAIPKIIFPYLEKVGLLWLTDHVIPAQEHFTSNLIIRKIIRAIDALPHHFKEGGKKILLFTPRKEFHEVPLLYIHYLLKKSGHKVIYYGTNVSIDDLKDYCESMPVTHMFFHLITNLTSLYVNEYLEKLAHAFPGTKIVVSGPRAKEAGSSTETVRLLRSLDELVSYCSE